MIDEVPFKGWGKIQRGIEYETITITEKIDGTNACVVIQNDVIAGVQSRRRFITPDSDNYGFAQWVSDNEDELLKLGDGYHYGEWAGVGIQKNNHNYPDKRLLLFNTFRWGGDDLPQCCHVVPVLYEGDYKQGIIQEVMSKLKSDSNDNGNTPEGVIIYYHKAKRYEKYTYEYERGKWAGK